MYVRARGRCRLTDADCDNEQCKERDCTGNEGELGSIACGRPRYACRESPGVSARHATPLHPCSGSAQNPCPNFLHSVLCRTRSHQLAGPGQVAPPTRVTHGFGNGWHCHPVPSPSIGSIPMPRASPCERATKARRPSRDAGGACEVGLEGSRCRSSASGTLRVHLRGRQEVQVQLVGYTREHGDTDLRYRPYLRARENPSARAAAGPELRLRTWSQNGAARGWARRYE